MAETNVGGDAEVIQSNAQLNELTNSIDRRAADVQEERNDNEIDEGHPHGSQTDEHGSATGTTNVRVSRVAYITTPSPSPTPPSALN